MNIQSNTAFGTADLQLSGASLTAQLGPRSLLNTTVLAANTTILGNQSLTFASPLVLNGNRVLTISNTALTTLAGGIGQIGGSRSFTKAGTQSLVINGTSTYTGTTTITGGTLALGSSGTISNGNLILQGGVLALSGTFSRPLGTGANEMRFAQSGGFAAYGDDLEIIGFTGNPVWGSTPNFLGNGHILLFGSLIGQGNVTWTNNFSLGNAERTISVSGNSTTMATISGIISSGAGGGLIKIGANLLNLNGLNTYTGQTKIQAGSIGVLTLGDIGSGPSSLGAPATASDGTIHLGSTTTAGTLLYLGSGSTSNRIINLAGTTGGGVVSNNGSGALILSGNVTATGNGNKTLTLSGTNTANNTLSGIIANHSGTALTALTKSGAGSWILSGHNLFTGNVTLLGGTLVVGHNSALGGGTVFLASANASLRGDGTPKTIHNSLLVSGGGTISGDSMLNFMGSLTQTGGNRILQITNTASTHFHGDVILAENNQTRIFTFNIAANATVQVHGSIQNGPGTGADGLTKTGAGELRLLQANSYNGTTTLAGGILSLGSNSALGTGTLAWSGLNSTLQAHGAPRTIPNPIAVSNNAAIGGDSALTLSGNFSQTGSRTISITNTSPTTLSGNLTLAENNTTRELTWLIASGSTLNLSGTVADGPGSGSDRMAQAGNGTLSLSGPNTFTGGFRLLGGHLQIGHDSALGTGNFTWVGSTAMISAVGGPRAIGNPILQTENLQITGSNDLTFTGNYLLTGANRTILVASSSNITFAGSSMTLGPSNQPRSLSLHVAATSNLVISSVIQNGIGTGPDSLVKQGTGPLTLLGNNTFSGGLFLQAGKLTFGHDSAAGTGSINLTGANVQLAGTGGARVLGNQLNQSANATITGNSPITFTGNFSATSSNLTLNISNLSNTAFSGPSFSLAPNNTASTLVLNVSAGATLTINSAIQNGTGTGPDGVLKAGAGSLLLQGNNTFTGRLEIAQGTVALGSNSTLNSSIPLTLSGGGIIFSSASQNMGSLKLSATSSLTLTTLTGNFSFANSSSESWLGSALLQIHGYVPGSHNLRFGTNSSGLTLAQLAQFRFVDQGNKPAQIDSLGFVTPIPEPTVTGGVVLLTLMALYRRHRRNRTVHRPSTRKS